MDEDRLSLLQEDVSDEKDRDCLIKGMGLLQAAKQSGSLAARYLTVLQQLRGENVQPRCTNTPQRSDVTEHGDSQGPVDFHNSLLPVDINPLDPIWDINLDLGNFDGWLSGAELSGDSSKSADTFMSW